MFAKPGIVPPARERALETELDELYQATRAQIGAADLEHIRRVAAYSRRIKSRSRELLKDGRTPGSFKRGVQLYMLHVLLEFSELGHNILHGSYDHLPDCGELHSDRWTWDFVADVDEWKVMHHQNHHPFTNIVGKDHDLGYSFLRLLPGQSWWGHHAAQPLLVASLMAFHLHYFTLYTAISAARVQGRPWLRWQTFARSAQHIRRYVTREYVREPLRAGSRFLRVLAGNYAGTALGYGFTAFLLLLEHHAENVALFDDPGASESAGDYYRRQILGTTNFTPSPTLDAALQQLLEQEVPFENRPPFEIFYGGLSTHLEHHLFPDLPCNRQRQIAPQVAEICARHGLPYNVVPFDEWVPSMLRSLVVLGAPVGEREAARPWTLLERPRTLLRRLTRGLLYREAPEPYCQSLRSPFARTVVESSVPEIGGNARTLRLRVPESLRDRQWAPGAYVSVRVDVDGAPHVRQYSLTRDSSLTSTFDITVKQIPGGAVSPRMLELRAGDEVTLVGPPQSTGEFLFTPTGRPVLFLAAGVGITPIMSMIRSLADRAADTDAVLLYFNRTKRSSIFADELAHLAAQTSLSVRCFYDAQPGEAPTRFSAERLSDVTRLDARAIYACGPEGFLSAIRAATDELGLAANLHVEAFTAEALKRDPAGEHRFHTVRFRRSNRAIRVNENTTLLQAAREAGVQLASGCEKGLCKACLVGKLDGRTQHEQPDGPVAIRVTACNALPRSDIELDL